MTIRHEFAIEAMVDFPDDAGRAPEPISEAHIDAMMCRLVECGVRRVSWGYYGDGHGGCFIPAPVLEGPDKSWTRAETYHRLGNPMMCICRANLPR